MKLSGRIERVVELTQRHSLHAATTTVAITSATIAIIATTTATEAKDRKLKYSGNVKPNKTHSVQTGCQKDV